MAVFRFRPLAALRALVAIGLAAAFAACQGGSMARDPDVGDARRPLQLNRAGGPPGQPASILVAIDEVELRKAVLNYNVNRKRDPGPYRFAGADLNEDGTPEAIVLFEGEDWCAPTGCSLGVFQMSQHGYRPLFRTVRVRAPVMVANAGNKGWRHLIVSTGGGQAPIKRVLLRFGDTGYPNNALNEPELPETSEITGEIAIDVRAEPPATPPAVARRR